MAQRARRVMMCLVICGLWPGIAWAMSDVEVLMNKLVEKGILTSTDAAQIRQEIAQVSAAHSTSVATTSPLSPDRAPAWQWNGDLRLRDEMRNQIGTGSDSHRQRIRFRYGFEGQVTDQLKVVGRMATGTSTDSSSPDPISTNDSFDDFFRKKPIHLDLAYAEYAPVVPGFSTVQLVGGIMENPLWTVTPMVWDGDLSWDGFAAKVRQSVGESLVLFSNNGVFLLDSDESEPSSLWVTQGGMSVTPFPGAEQDLLKHLKLTGALAYHDYRNVANAGKAGTDPIARESDNTAAAMDFNQLNPSVEVASQLGSIPMALFGDWVHNTSSSTEGNDGFAIGIKVGKAKTPWSLTEGWEVGYLFERLEQDAAFDEFVDSDFGGGGTNRLGNVFWLTLATLKHSTLGLKYFASEEVRGTKAGENRAQIDWLTRF